MSDLLLILFAVYSIITIIMFFIRAIKSHGNVSYGKLLFIALLWPITFLWLLFDEED